MEGRSGYKREVSHDGVTRCTWPVGGVLLLAAVFINGDFLDLSTAALNHRVAL